MAAKGSASRRPAPVSERTVPAKALDQALRIAGGDPSRLRIEADGSVTVLNKSRGELRKGR